MILDQKEIISIDQFENEMKYNLISNVIFETRPFENKSSSYYKMYIYISSKTEGFNINLTNFNFILYQNDPYKIFPCLNLTPNYRVTTNLTQQVQLLEFDIPSTEISFKTKKRFIYEFNSTQDSKMTAGYIDLDLSKTFSKTNDFDYLEQLFPCCLYGSEVFDLLTNNLSIKTPAFIPLKNYQQLLQVNNKYLDNLPICLDKNVELSTDLNLNFNEIKVPKIALSKFSILTTNSINNKYIAKPSLSFESKKLYSTNKCELKDDQIVEGTTNSGYMFYDSRGIEQKLVFDLSYDDFSFEINQQLIFNETKQLQFEDKYYSLIKINQNYSFPIDFYNKVRNDQKYQFIDEVKTYEKT